MGIFDLARSAYGALHHRLEMRKYDEYTIAEYFRKQGARIGDHCYICVSELAGEPYLVKMGNNVSISSGVRLLTHTIAWGYRSVVPDIQSFGRIIIEDNCSIGVGSIILPNTTIGKNSIVGAGVVVSGDVPPDSVVMSGRPKIFKGMIPDYFAMIDAQWKKQRPEGYLKDFEQMKNKTPANFNVCRAQPYNRQLLRAHLEKIFWGDHDARKN